MTRAERYAQFKPLRDQGLTYREIGERCGVHLKTVFDVLNDPTGEKVRARKAKVPGGTCIDCGGPTCPNSGSAPRPRCRQCSDVYVGELAGEREREKWLPRRQQIVELWHQGLTLRQIAGALDTTRESVGATVSKMRLEGFDLPYRRCETDRSRRQVAA